jgi:hypothetical protein
MTNERGGATKKLPGKKKNYLYAARTFLPEKTFFYLLKTLSSSDTP